MICVVAPFPSASNEKDGYYQRINAIEQSILDVPRIYLEISFLGNFLFSKRKCSEYLTVYRFNFFLHFPFFLYLGLKSKKLYVHTVQNGFKVLPLYFFKTVFTDLHGIGSEEAVLIGRKLRSKVHSFSEYFVMRWSQRLVVVTKKMSEFIKKKYSDLKLEFLYIPVFNPLPLSKPLKKNNDKTKPVIIYSGGVYGWQNIEKMIEATEKLCERFQFLFLVSDIEYLKSKFTNAAFIKSIEINSVPRNEMPNYYEKADFGFLLREDNSVNQVACPTKMIEYIQFGIIPILLQPNIGDFKDLGLRYVLLDDLFNDNGVDRLDFDEMRKSNMEVLNKIKSHYEVGLKLLKKELL